MPILSVTNFLSLADKIIGLLKDRQVRKRDYFDKIIDPLYSQFVVVGEDYLKLFREARVSLEKAPKKATIQQKFELLNGIRNRREEFLASRLRVRGLVEAFDPHAEKEKDRELLALLEAMRKFFYGSGYRSSFGSVGYQLVDLFSIWAEPDQKEIQHDNFPIAHRIAADVRARDAARKDIGEFVSRSLRSLEDAWFEVAGRYAHLRMKYLGDKQL